jgi:hypothetical protein
MPQTYRFGLVLDRSLSLQLHKRMQQENKSLSQVISELLEKEFQETKRNPYKWKRMTSFIFQ